MQKKRPSSPTLKSLLKNTSLSSIIALLLFAIYQLVGDLSPLSLPTEASSKIAYSQPATLHSSSDTLKLYSNQTQDDLKALYLSAIQNAKESITFSIYSLVNQEVIHALNQKVEAGIPVHIVCDAKASIGISRKLPKATIVKRLSQGLMHQKILIVDQKQILLGSANMTTESLRTHGNLVFNMQHPALAQALTEKAKSMDEEGNTSKLMHCQARIGNQDLELWVLPDDPDAVKRMIQLFQSAKKTIKVAMFTWTRADFTQELIAASKRGVRVEAVIDRYSGKGTSAKVVRMLNEAGIPVRLSTGQGLLHHKFAYIDDAILVNGSANWTQSAFKANDDCFIVLNSLLPEQKNKK
ncbi:hypothetical protein PNK_1496 [Candidatus Protochlamydia naegleriophila]|uniref:phospholipase D n=1 Tax=Candidatus Protochlamydia naegleriophila TaxID=389348 RepID=A0A0U5JET7_9BACT|nr:phospholipase D-like domain-containing protein [Candidatus Protochlamydia naegleriophila]CUI17106.1 hypothetical protein PNK_1496 [Candidatus Protochlamydia naegleriophila]